MKKFWNYVVEKGKKKGIIWVLLFLLIVCYGLALAARKGVDCLISSVRGGEKVEQVQGGQSPTTKPKQTVLVQPATKVQPSKSGSSRVKDFYPYGKEEKKVVEKVEASTPTPVTPEKETPTASRPKATAQTASPQSSRRQSAPAQGGVYTTPVRNYSNGDQWIAGAGMFRGKSGYYITPPGFTASDDQGQWSPFEQFKRSHPDQASRIMARGGR